MIKFFRGFAQNGAQASLAMTAKNSLAHFARACFTWNMPNHWQFWRAGASSRVTKRTLVGLAPEYVQKRRKSSLFCGYAPNFFQSSKSAPVRNLSAKSTRCPAPLYPQRGRVSSLFCAYAANFSKSEKSPQRGSKFTKIWAKPAKSS